MRRSVVFLLGVAVFATGIWLIATEHSKTSACSNAGGPFSGLGPSCQSVGWAYFAGFIVAGLGLIVLLYTRLMPRHEGHYKRRPSGPPELSLHMRAAARLAETTAGAPATPATPPARRRARRATRAASSRTP